MKAIDWNKINQAILMDAEGFCAQLLPGGRRVGKEWVCGDLNGGSGRSFSVNLTNGRYADFSSGKETKGKDFIALYSAVHGINNAKAARELESKYGTPTIKPNGHARPNGTAKPNGHAKASEYHHDPEAIVITPIPDSVPTCRCTHPKHGPAANSWRYLDAQGRLLGLVARYNITDDKGQPGKAYTTWTWSGKKWQMKSWPEPRPLFGLDDLALRPDAVVCVVEGEQAVLAARKLCPQHVVVAWPNGAQSWQKADWTPLYGRKVIFWPDADEAGIAAMDGISKLLSSHCPQMRRVDVSGLPPAWDAADALAEGWTPERIIQQMKIADVTTAVIVTEVAKPARLATALDRNALWLEWSLECNGSGKPHSNLGNASVILENDPACQGLIWYDEFLQRIMTGDPPREWTDAAEIHLQLHIQNDIGIATMGDSHVHRAVIEYARRHQRHCVKDWLATLKWDGIPRVDHFFEDHFGAPATAYTRAASKNFWLSMLARIYRPGCKVDTMVVLEGNQGVGKSKCLHAVGGPWWTSQHSEVTSKAFFEVIQGKIIVEIGEFQSFRGAEVEKVKDVVSCPIDRFRIPYSIYAEDHPRTCIFAASTNDPDWNKDPTGARRFNPITCTDADVEGVASNRDQLFAESVHRLNPMGQWLGLPGFGALGQFENGETWWDMPQDETLRIQEEHYIGGVWHDEIGIYITGRRDVSLKEIFTECIKMDIDKVGRKDELTVGAALRSLGWRSHPTRDLTGKLRRLWKPTE